jgi:hypothetical protein
MAKSSHPAGSDLADARQPSPWDRAMAGGTKNWRMSLAASFSATAATRSGRGRWRPDAVPWVNYTANRPFGWPGSRKRVDPELELPRLGQALGQADGAVQLRQRRPAYRQLRSVYKRICVKQDSVGRGSASWWRPLARPCCSLSLRHQGRRLAQADA